MFNISKTKEVSAKVQAAWNTVSLIASLAVNYLILIFLIRMGKLDDAGIFSLCLAVVSIFEVISLYNMKTFQIADNYTMFSESSYVFSRFFSILISFVCYFIFLLFIQYENRVSLIITLYFLYRNIIILFDVFATKIQIKKRLDILGKLSLPHCLFSIIIFIKIYTLSQDLFLAFFCLIVFSIIFSISSTFCVYKKVVGMNMFRVIEYKPKYILEAYHLLRLCFPLCISVLLTVLISAISKILLAKYTDTVIVGIFSALSAPAVLLPTVANSFFAPYILHFTDLFYKKKYRIILKNIFLITLLIFTGCVVALILNRFLGLKIFQLIYGNKITDFFSFFTPILIANFILSFSTIISIILTIADKRRFILIIALIVTILGYPALLYLIKRYNLSGACLGILLIYSLQAALLILGLLYTCKKTTNSFLPMNNLLIMVVL